MCQIEREDVVVTDEMREAGATEFLQFDGLMFGTPEGAAANIFKAMAVLSPQFCTPQAARAPSESDR